MTSDSSPLPFDLVARFPAAGDNAAIALSDLKQGTRIRHGSETIVMQHDVLTGHRFAAERIENGSPLTSWNYPFGHAARTIQPGEYLCNKNVWFRLSIQEKEPYKSLHLPAEPNFTDDIEPYHFDAGQWQQPAPVERSDEPADFLGYDRGPRGTGTRNQLVILGTSSTTAPLVEKLETHFRGRSDSFDTVDAIVGLRHTEGAETEADERERTLRTLAGLLCNPNVGGFVAIESGAPGELTNAMLEAWMRAHNTMPDASRMHWLRATDSFEQDLENATASVETLLTKVATDRRTPRPLSELRIGLQCGASDAFSGICGNVLSAAIAREVIRHGGSANLTETPELSGAEDYTLSSITDPAIATRFLSMLDRFKEQLGWHGGKVDKNPSEGNLLGGLYNITLKSLGAAVKRDPSIPIEQIIEYAEPMRAPGFHFMDGMGGDIASYTGQAAAGCNIILFVTGRGTPTNSSIVPTIKIVNTTARYQLMAGDIDINAGQYLDGQSMESLTDEAMAQVVTIASGTRTKGERRSQNIDLTWRRRYYESAPVIEATEVPSRYSGQPIPLHAPEPQPLDLSFTGRSGAERVLPAPAVGLVIPTVGCSVATARQATQRLNESELVSSGRIDRFVVLANTEGCGVTTGSEVLNFILSYATHASVEACLFLSLGCEMVSPGFIKSAMRGEDIGFSEISAAAKRAQITPEQYGWLTIQEAGGTEQSAAAVEDWFTKTLNLRPAPARQTGNARDIRLGLMTTGPVSAPLAQSLFELTARIVQSGGSVVIPENSSLWQYATAAELVDASPAASLAFAQNIEHPGLHRMQQIGDNPLETVTGLGAATDVILNVTTTRPIPGHSLIPTLNLTADAGGGDFDLQLDPATPAAWPQAMAELIRKTLSGDHTPRQQTIGNTGNQIPRGPRAHAI